MTLPGGTDRRNCLVELAGPLAIVEDLAAEAVWAGPAVRMLNAIGAIDTLGLTGGCGITQRRWPVANRLSEPDEVTLCVLALLERTTVAEQRRRAVQAFARAARQDAHVDQIVRLILARRREREHGGSNVVSLRGSRRS